MGVSNLDAVALWTSWGCWVTVSTASDHGLKTEDVKRLHGCFAGGTVPRRQGQRKRWHIRDTARSCLVEENPKRWK